MSARVIFLLFGLLSLFPTLGLGLTFPLPPAGEDLVGETQTITTQYEDTLSDIAREFDLGFLEITTANPKVDAWLPGEGTEVIIPTRFILPPGPRKGVVINLAELRLYYYPRNRREVVTYPLGIGREGWSTPTGKARVIGKKAYPDWRPPKSIREEHEEQGDPLPELVKAGPDNPLGDYALYLSMPGYLLHGTNKPYGVGMRVSHGCIRLYPEDIESLFKRLPVNTPVRIINEPYKAGWAAGKFYVEAHPPLSEQLAAEGQNYTPMIRAIIKTLGNTPVKPDWKAVTETAREQIGIPFAVPMQ